MKNIPFTESELKQIKEFYSQELDKLEKRTSEVKNLLKKFDSADKVEKATTVESKEVKVQAKKSGRKNATTVKADSKPAEVASSVPVKSTKKVKTAKVAKEKAAPKAKNVKAKKAVKAAPVATANAAKPAKSVKPVKAAKAPKASKAAKPAKATKVVKSAKASKPAKTDKGTTKREFSGRKANWSEFIINLLKSNNQLLPSRFFVDAAMKRNNLTEKDFIKTRGLIATKLSDMFKNTKTLMLFEQPGKKGGLYGLPEWFDEKGNLLDKSKMKA